MSTTGTEGSAYLDPVRADLAARLEIDPSQVRVVSIEEKTWPDGSLGCPEPGRSYTQALVNGSQVILEAVGQRYDYRVVTPDQFKLCQPRPRVPES